MRLIEVSKDSCSVMWKNNESGYNIEISTEKKVLPTIDLLGTINTFFSRHFNLCIHLFPSNRVVHAFLD